MAEENNYAPSENLAEQMPGERERALRVRHLGATNLTGRKVKWIGLKPDHTGGTGDGGLITMSHRALKA